MRVIRERPQKRYLNRLRHYIWKYFRQQLLLRRLTLGEEAENDRIIIRRPVREVLLSGVVLQLYIKVFGYFLIILR